MGEKEYKRRVTRIGLGSGEHGKLETAEPRTREIERVIVAERNEARSRATLPAPPEPEPRVITLRPPLAAPSSPAPRRRTNRRPIAVDDIGQAAVEIASRPPTAGRPKVVKTPEELADAPLDAREAFLLSLIDGKTPVPVLVDLAGMTEGEMTGILARLRRLGIIAYV